MMQMYTAQIQFKIVDCSNVEDAADAVVGLLGQWWKNGRIVGRHERLALSDKRISAFVSIPEPTSLDGPAARAGVASNLSEVLDAGLSRPIVVPLGEDPAGASVCTCKQRSSLALFTTFLSLSGPLSCRHCSGDVPLYQLPPTYMETEYWNLLMWQESYEAVDTLWMRSSTGERLARAQMQDHDSALSAEGRGLCSLVERLTGIATYYYLAKHTARSFKRELGRRCPNCDGEWLLAEPEGLYNFRCDPCRLLSNIAFSVSRFR